MNAMKIMKGLVLAGSMVCATALQAAIDPALPEYKATTGVSGNVNSIGSDTLNNLMTLWAEGFKKAYPNVNIQIEGKGSSTAPPALIAGTAQIGPMSSCPVMPSLGCACTSRTVSGISARLTTSRRIASATRGLGGYGHSLVLSLVQPGSVGWSPGV